MSKFTAENNNLEPTYDVEDIGCACNEEGFDSDWQWDIEQQCYICNGCGEVQ